MNGETAWKVKYSVGLYKCRTLDKGPVSTETDWNGKSMGTGRRGPDAQDPA